MPNLDFSCATISEITGARLTPPPPLSWLSRSRVNLYHLQQVSFVHFSSMIHNKDVIDVTSFTIRCSLD